MRTCKKIKQIQLIIKIITKNMQNNYNKRKTNLKNNHKISVPKKSDC